MPTIEETVEVRVPVRTAYDQWTRFEDFPRFMEGVREVRRIDDTHLHWVGDEAGDDAEWETEIVAQEPDHRISWRSTGGPRNDATVAFEPMGDDATRVHLAIDQETAAGEDGDLAQRRVRGDVERFRELVESRAPSADGDGDAVDPRDEPDAAVGPEGYTETTRLPSLSRLMGMTVCNLDDEKVGKIREVYLDGDADHVRYLGISTGWLSRGIHVVPVDDVTYVDDGAETYVVVPYSVEHLKAAPSLDDGDQLSAEREREIYDHYARVGYWEAARDAVRARQTPPAPTPQIAEAEVADAIARGEDPAGVRVRRWGV
jgi:hypothetical protein